MLLGISFATTFMPDAKDEMAVVGCCACTTYTDIHHPPDWQREADIVKAHYPPGEKWSMYDITISYHRDGYS